MAAPKKYYRDPDNPDAGWTKIQDPENITRDECLALACLGKDAWNTWRREFPVNQSKNKADFSRRDFRTHPVSFDGFIFGHHAQFDGAQFGKEAQFVGARFGDKARFHRAQFDIYAQFNDAQFGYEAQFDGAQFSDAAQFKGAQFGDDAQFIGVQFGDEARFNDVRFGDFAQFNGTRFGDRTQFIGVQFGNEAQFNGAQFGDRTPFNDAQFGDNAQFIGVLFGDEARFDSVRFGDRAHFDGAQFGDRAQFDGTTFNGNVSFAGQEWSRLSQLPSLSAYLTPDRTQTAQQKGLSPNSFQAISFAGTIFKGTVDFSDRAFRGRTRFDVANLPTIGKPQATKFAKAPLFHGSELHQDTSFDNAIFPAATGDLDAARAYRTLKLAFTGMQATREEQRFFRLEMAEEAKHYIERRDRRALLFWSYRVLSDYGFSVWRPLALLACTTFAAFLLYAWQIGAAPCNPFAQACGATTPLLHFTVANAFPGLEKLAEPAAKALFGAEMPYSLATVVTLLVQKAITLLSLFLVGLALRNLFKMK